ncbi:GrpB family protein [Cellvibrio mixtus]|uniref:GrpB family protein n=1 Tax=Cellvibrio mixtus TaxID=39650 RepID=UPI000586EC24|nr:GrpB family protein [Cellvibrio mixtus]
MKFYKESEYRAACEALFQKYKVSILNLIPHARVEHVGSSSIPGAISKGDLDVFVGVSPEKFNESIMLLKKLGFREKLETLRAPALCMLESGIEDVALQVVANGSTFEFFIEFREKLKASAALLDQYNQLKLTCIDLSDEQYRELKSEFIERVLRK